MDLQITGKVKQILEVQSGESKNGPWKKQDFILETEGKFPKLVCITQWGDQIDQNSLSVDETITAHIDIQSREFKGRWYTDVKAWKIERGAQQGGGAAANPDDNIIDFGPEDDDDGLPF
ncbi:MAG: DUF3127 domain-containing protein [Balneolaceae bacterium]|nr:DUF3127 domain-containing protein [Balneolaceae bacterium]MCH8549685.1 DUF3127 domain-containing protein [Balneolaceae bacterium]